MTIHHFAGSCSVSNSISAKCGGYCHVYGVTAGRGHGGRMLGCVL